MLIHVFGNVGNVKVRVAVVGKLLQFRVERFLYGQRAARNNVQVVTYSSKADLVTKVMEATNAVLSVLKVVVLDESKAKQE